MLERIDVACGFYVISRLGRIRRRPAGGYRIAREKALPFEPLVPNETTIAAMREARAGNLEGFDSVEALMADLHAKD